ncbi:MAG: HEAT repeat domain-containing protein, partial [Candidatus Paceibacterales bacterium]
LKAFREAIQDKDSGVRGSAVLALGHFEHTSKKVIPVLVELLKNHDPRLRSDAAFVLAEMGSAAKEALPALIECIKDKDLNVRFGVANALGNIGRPAEAAVPILVESLAYEDSNWNAAIALVAINPKKAVPAIPVFKKVLELNTDDLADRAAIELDKIGTPEARALVQQYRERVKSRLNKS